MVVRVVRNGEVAVLYSPGFGAGWSTWNGEYAETLLFSPALVAWVEGGKKGDVDLILASLGADIYSGGADQLEIKWLAEGTRFQIEEYDGSESIRTVEDLSFTA